VVAGQGNGLLLCGYNQPDDFAWAINYLLANPGAAREMGKKGRQLAKSRFSWARVAGELLTYYEKITG
jgi:spore coat protein SA